MGLGVGFGVWGLGSGVWGLGSGVRGPGSGVWGLGSLFFLSGCWGNLEQRMPRSSTDFLFLLATDPSNVVMVNEGGHFTTALVEGLRELGVSLASLYDFCHWECLI